MNDAVLDFYADALVALLALCNAVFDTLRLKQRRRTERAAGIYFFDRIFVCFLFLHRSSLLLLLCFSFSAGSSFGTIFGFND